MREQHVFRLKPMAAALGLVLTPMLPVAAQTIDAIADETPEVTLSTLRVVNTAEEELKQSLGVSIITAEDLKYRPPANDLSEILMTQPGISLSGASSVGAYGNQREIDIRGMGAENTMILIDGKPVQSRQGAITRRTGDRDTGGDTNWVPADQIERIEIIRGPAAARYGSGASGGVINIITKKPTGDFSGSITAYASKPEDELEGNGTRRLGFNLAGPIVGDLSFRLYGSAAKTDGDEPTINGVTDEGDPNWIAGREGRRNRDATGLLRWDLTPDQVVEFEAGFSRQGNIYAGEAANTTPSALMQEWADRGAETRRVYRRNAAVTHRGTWDSLGSSRLLFQYENTDTINCRQGAGGMGEANCGTEGDTQRSDMDNYFVNGELNTPLSLGSLDQILTTGIEFRSTKLLDNNALLQNAGGGAGSTPGGDGFVEIKNDTIAFYLEDSIAVGQSLMLIPGIRFDHHSQFGNNWSPSFNAFYELGGGFSLKGGIARVFKAPTLYQTAPSYLSNLGGACPYNGNDLGLISGDDYDCGVSGNPDLDAETSVNKEIGVAWNGPNGWDSSLAYFRNDYKNRIVADSPVSIQDLLADLEDGVIDSPANFQWKNGGKALVEGFEGSFNVPLLGTNGNRLKFYNNITWMLKNHSTETGQPLSIIPKYTLNSSLFWRTTESFSMQLTSTLYGRRTPRTVSYHGYPMTGLAVRERPSYVLVGLNGTWEFNRHHRVGFGVSNLFDREIKRAARLASANVAAGPLEDRVITTGAGALTYNEPGRAYYVTYTASF